VKLYSDEPRTDEIERLTIISVAEIARVEVPAALWRKNRRREISAGDANVLVAAFEGDFYGVGPQPARFGVVATTNEILERAAALCATHALRAYDAVQLASALAAREADPEFVGFAVFDHDLRDAAAQLGLTVVPDNR